MKLLKQNAWLSASLLVFFASACGDEEEDAATALTGSSIYSCTIIGEMCYEVRDVSEVMAKTGAETCPQSATGAQAACTNKDSTPGVCISKTGELTTYTYTNTSDVVTADIIKSTCESGGGTFTASE